MARNVPPPLDKVDPAEAWKPWEPDTQNPWGRKWAAHLYRRAGFGANQAELDEADQKGHKVTLERILNGDPKAAVLEDFLRKEGLKIAKRYNPQPFQRNEPSELRAWWLYCMLNSGHPLREKMTLFWHNHFVSSIAKVQRGTPMINQNLLLRKHALGKFGPFLLEIGKDVAMLVYLDGNSNIKGRPNENYAREVMELFSLGVGNYTEHDIREAARAFTGWHTNGDEFEYNAKFHDDGEKTVFGESGNFNGDDVVKLILKKDACALYLTRKLYRYFISEVGTPPNALLEPLADQLRKSDYDVGALVRTMLSSRHFFSEYAYHQKIKSPVEYVLGAARAVVDGSIGQQLLVPKIEAMGQMLFAPPNVKGWPGGEAWLNTSTILARQNFAQALAMGMLWRGRPPRQASIFEPEVDEIELAQPDAPPGAPGKPGEPPPKPEEPPPPAAVDPARVVRDQKVTKPEDVVRVLVDLYLPGGVGDKARARLVAFVDKGKPEGKALDRRVRETVHALMSMPEYQLA
jgi:uncharacterized protein (DUF1800 family)